MKRYFSHYTYIYPDIFLKNHIVEIDDEDRITHYFPYKKEIEKTEFYSGWLLFMPINESVNIESVLVEIGGIHGDSIFSEYKPIPDKRYKMFYPESF